MVCEYYPQMKFKRCKIMPMKEWNCIISREMGMGYADTIIVDVIILKYN